MVDYINSDYLDGYNIITQMVATRDNCAKCVYPFISIIIYLAHLICVCVVPVCRAFIQIILLAVF